MLQVREHCLGLLTKALEENAASRVECNTDPTEAAVEVEYATFCSSKAPQTYKLSINKRVRPKIVSHHRRVTEIVMS